MLNQSIKIFGTWWCGDCFRTRQLFKKHKISYQWVDIDEDHDGEEFVIKTNNGNRSVPTILFEDGSILVEPTNDQLLQKLGIINF